MATPEAWPSSHIQRAAPHPPTLRSAGRTLALAAVLGLAVALAMAGAGWLVLRASWRLPLTARAPLFGITTAATALAAELALRLTGSPDAAMLPVELVTRALRWSIVALAVGGLLLAWASALQADEALRRAQQQRLAADMQLADLRLQSLQSQIEPHFLFNTLATVRRLGDTDPGQCTRLLDHLHDFVRLGHVAGPGRAECIGA